MGVISVTNVLSVSSEDSKYPASNLLKGQKWLTAPSTTVEEVSVDLQLDNSYQIGFVDVGYFNTATVEILVKSSQWPHYKQAMTLLPVSTLTNQMDCRTGKNKEGLKMFKMQEHFKDDVMKKAWDVVRIILRQPYARNKQMGLNTLRFSGTQKIVKATIRSSSSGGTSSSATPSKDRQSSNLARFMDSVNKRTSASPMRSPLIQNPSLMSRNYRMLMDAKNKSQTSSPQRSTDSPSRKDHNAARKPMSAASALRERINKELAEKENKKAQQLKQDALVSKRDSDGTLNFSLRESTSSPDKTSPINNVPSPQRKCSPGRLQSENFFKPIVKNPTSPRTTNASSNEQKKPVTPRRNSFSPAVKRTSDSSSPLAKKLSMTPPDAKKRLVNGGSSSGSSTASKKIVTSQNKNKKVVTASGASSGPKRQIINGVLSSSASAQSSSKSDSPKRPAGSPQPQKKDEKPALANKFPDFTNCTDAKPAKVGTEMEQKRLLTKAIKRFYNAIDINSIDRATIKIRHVRKIFEQKHDLTLNERGRECFFELSQTYFKMLLTYNKNGGSSAATKKETDDAVDVVDVDDVITSSVPHIAISSPVTVEIVSRALSVTPSVSTNSRPPQPSIPPPSNIHTVECPICSGHYSGTVIEAHAATCDGFPEFTPTAGGHSSSSRAYSSLAPRSYSSSTNQNASNDVEFIRAGSNTVVDTSENSLLSKEEQRGWIEFSRQPKPYQERLNRDDFKGCKLVKCPTCHQKYKESDIALHSDDCAEKVNSGYTRVGLYLVKNDKKAPKKKPKQRAIMDPIVLD